MITNQEDIHEREALEILVYFLILSAIFLNLLLSFLGYFFLPCFLFLRVVPAFFL
jgi:hypothetical protein